MPPRPRPRRLWQVPVFFLGLGTLLGVTLGRPFWPPPEGAPAARDLAQARQLFAQPETTPFQLRAFVERALQQSDRFPQRAGEAHFLLGSAFLRQTGKAIGPADYVVSPARRPDPEPLPKEVADAWQKARVHLERAENLGVPEADGLSLTYRLGKVWYHFREDPGRVADYLARSVEEAADDAAEGYAMLTQAYLRQSPPNLQGALDANKKQLDLPTGNDEVLAPARLLRGDLLLRAGNAEAAQEALQFIKPSAAPTLVVQARYLQARACQEQEQWEKAAQFWKQTLEDRSGIIPESVVPLYNLGICYRNLERPADAARAWEQVLSQGRGDEGPAAALGLAELRLVESNPQTALEAFARAVRDVKAPEEWNNSFWDLARTRNLFERGCLIFHATGRYELSMQLAQLYEKLAAPGAASLLYARAAESAGRVKLDQARQVRPPENAQPIAEAAWSYFRQAARKHEGAADSAPSPAEQAERLWHAAACYQQGQDPASSIRLLERLVGIGQPAERLGQVWYALAEAHRALQQEDAALAAFAECLKQPGPYAQRARYQLALVQIAHGQWDRAAEDLEQNLQLLRAEPDPEAQERTLFELCSLFFRRKNYFAATQRLEEALRLFPTSVQAPTARYQLGESCRQLAVLESQNLRLPERITREAQDHFMAQYRAWLQKGVASFEELLRSLTDRVNRGALTPDEETLFRLASLADADCRSNLGDYNGAISIYEGMVIRYHHRGDSLYALASIAVCQWRKQEQEQAQATLGRMRAALKEMDDTAFIGPPGTMTRADWEKWIADRNKP
jgi:tetratricopeptide (TPR) repeat protein